MVKQASKMAVVLLSAGLMVGCATKSDLNKVQGQVDDLKSQVAAVKSTADRAAAAAEAANGKLDRMFQKAMKK